jgi:hypothetical protein
MEEHTKIEDREKVDQALRLRTLWALTEHVGAMNAIGMGELYERVTGQRWENRINDTRPIRTIITRLRREGLRICSSPDRNGGGYYLAATGSELSDYLRKNKIRALKMLKMNSTMLRVSLPELLGQMKLELEVEGSHESQAV